MLKERKRKVFVSLTQIIQDKRISTFWPKFLLVSPLAHPTCRSSDGLLFEMLSHYISAINQQAAVTTTAAAADQSLPYFPSPSALTVVWPFEEPPLQLNLILVFRLPFLFAFLSFFSPLLSLPFLFQKIPGFEIECVLSTGFFWKTKFGFWFLVFLTNRTCICLSIFLWLPTHDAKLQGVILPAFGNVGCVCCRFFQPISLSYTSTCRSVCVCWSFNRLVWFQK